VFGAEVIHQSSLFFTSSRVSYIAGNGIYLSICASAAASINANSLHAARQLLHQGVKLSNFAVTVFLSGLRAQKRRGALLAEFACQTGKPDNLTTSRDEQHPTLNDALQSLTAIA
jgi:hypothetical protein